MRYFLTNFGDVSNNDNVVLRPDKMCCEKLAMNKVCGLDQIAAHLKLASHVIYVTCYVSFWIVNAWRII